MGDAHDDVPKFLKKLALKGFSEEVGDHDAGRAVDEFDIPVFDAVLDKKVADVDVAGFLSGRGTSIAFHLHGTHAVLEKFALVDLVALGFDEIFRPDCLWEEVTGSYELGFGGTFGVKFLLGGLGVECALAHRNDATGVAAHVVVQGVRCVHPGFHDA